MLSCVRTCPECFGARTVCSFVCRFPTHPFVGLLVSAACSLLSHSTSCQHTISRMQVPQDVSHNRVLIAPTRRQQEKFIGAVKLADEDSSNPSHIQFGPIFGMVSSQPDLSEWNDFASVVLASKTTIPRSIHFRMIHNPCTVPNHPTHQHEMLAAVPELSNLLFLHAPSSLSSLLASQSQQDSSIGTA